MMDNPDSAERNGVFICHASEDKTSVIEPLTQAFRRAGIRYWIDSENIKWGDSVSKIIGEGIRRSQFAILVLSKSFLQKRWPDRELNATLSLETGSGKMKTLPLLVGTKAERDDILAEYPLLSDKRYMVWENDPSPIVREYTAVLNGGDSMTTTAPAIASPATPVPGIPVYRPRQAFTDYQKSQFIREAFRNIEEYFKTGLQQLKASNSRIDIDFVRVSEVKFSATFYVDGELTNSCVLWLGSTFRDKQISYREGRSIDYQNDGSMNDWLYVEADEREIFLRGGFGARIDDRLTPREAAEYLWKRFISK